MKMENFTWILTYIPDDGAAAPPSRIDSQPVNAFYLALGSV